ncbi:MAG: phosphoribosylglycinamide formyltransferase [Spirochaetes bacterium]|nr:phosphoribosylglycinamide formyltransferase [Spirochaetota bacterium]
MAKVSVFASGNGSNFEAIVKALQGTPHQVVCLISDNEKAYALERAKRLQIPYHVFPFRSPTERRESEVNILNLLRSYGTDFIALAGFMKLLSPLLIDAYPNRIVNLHPSLLPKYPGTQGIRDSYLSGDKELGITIHYVDYGLDTGPIITQRSFRREGTETLEEIEEKIHTLEHEVYPKVLIELLDALERHT